MSHDEAEMHNKTIERAAIIAAEQCAECSEYLHKGTHGRQVDSFHRPSLQIEVAAGINVPVGVDNGDERR